MAIYHFTDDFGQPWIAIGPAAQRLHALYGPSGDGIGIGLVALTEPGPTQDWFYNQMAYKVEALHAAAEAFRTYGGQDLWAACGIMAKELLEASWARLKR